MRYFISKNDEQLGLFETMAVTEMLKNGDLSPNDFAVKQGELHWKPLAEMFQSPSSAPIKKSGFSLTIIVAALGGFLIIGGGLFLAFYFLKFFPNKNSIINSNSSLPHSEIYQTYPDTSPDNKTDFKMSAEVFYQETKLDSSKHKIGLDKFNEKVVEIVGRNYLSQTFDGKTISLKTTGFPISLELAPYQATKLLQLTDYERIRAKCEVFGTTWAELKNCQILERKPTMTKQEAPDFTITAQELYNQIEDWKLPYEQKKKNREKYFLKIIDITGKVKKESGLANRFLVNKSDWLSCKYDEENKKQFETLNDGEVAKFRVLDDGGFLAHCTVLN